MSEQHESASTPARASPWPLFVALGLTLSELGVLFGSSPVSVGGILLLSASVVGILRESKYASTLYVPGLAVGGLFTAVGAVVYVFTSLTFRGSYVTVAGVIVVVASVVLALYEREYL